MAPLPDATNETPPLSAEPTQLPTPLPADAKIDRPGWSPGLIVSALMGFLCTGYIAYLGYVMIKK